MGIEHLSFFWKYLNFNGEWCFLTLELYGYSVVGEFLTEESGLHAFQLTYSFGSDFLEIPNCIMSDLSWFQIVSFWVSSYKAGYVGVMENKRKRKRVF